MNWVNISWDFQNLRVFSLLVDHLTQFYMNIDSENHCKEKITHHLPNKKSLNLLEKSIFRPFCSELEQNQFQSHILEKLFEKNSLRSWNFERRSRSIFWSRAHSSNILGKNVIEYLNIILRANLRSLNTELFIGNK